MPMVRPADKEKIWFICFCFINVCLHACMWTIWVPGAHKDQRFPGRHGTGVINVCQLFSECRELNPGSLQSGKCSLSLGYLFFPQELLVGIYEGNCEVRMKLTFKN